MQVSVDKSLGVIHEDVAELGDLGVQRGVVIKEVLDKFLVAGGYDVAVPLVIRDGHVRLGEYKILGDVAQLGVEEELYVLLLLGAGQDEIGRRQERVREEGGEILAQVGVDAVCHKLLAEIFICGDVFHGQRAHDLVVMIDLRNICRSEL